MDDFYKVIKKCVSRKATLVQVFISPQVAATASSLVSRLSSLEQG